MFCFLLFSGTYMRNLICCILFLTFDSTHASLLHVDVDAHAAEKKATKRCREEELSPNSPLNSSSVKPSPSKKIKTSDSNVFRDSKEIESYDSQLKYPYAQSMGYLKAFLNDKFSEIRPEHQEQDIRKNIYNFYMIFNLKDYLKIKEDANHPNTIPVIEALLQEHIESDRDFAYHGATPWVGLLYDTYSEFRRQLMGLEGADLFVSRGTDQVFSGLSNIADFITEQLEKQNIPSFGELNNYGADFSDKALSVNFFLFGNHNHAFDNTIQFFIEGSSERDILLKKSLFRLFIYFGIDASKTNEIDNLLSEFETLPLLDRGRLFQFSFAPGVIDHYTYLSRCLGGGVTLDESKHYAPEKKQVEELINSICETPQETKKKLETKIIPRTKENFNLQHHTQGRFLSHPDLFSQDNRMRAYSYWRGLSREAPEVLEYRKRLNILVARVVAQIREKAIILPKNTILSNDNSKGLSFLRRSSSRDAIEEAQISRLDKISDPLLSAYICAGDLEQFTQATEGDSSLDINKKIIDINDIEDETEHSPLYLAIKYNQRDVAHYLIKKGAVVDNELADERNLIGWACMHNYPLIVQALLKLGVDPNSTFRVRFMRNPIIKIAVDHGHDEIIENLMSHTNFSPDPETCEEILSALIKAENCKLLKLFTEKVTFDFNKSLGHSSKNALSKAIRTSNTELIRILLDTGKVSLGFSFFFSAY